jgi:hypothetical protein
VINPEGLETSYFFKYGLSNEEYFASTAFESTGLLTEETRFTAAIAELQPATTYHYRVVTLNELGISTSEDETFTTPPAEPTVNDRPPFATGISLHEATLHGTVNPGSGVTTYHFQYGATTEYGSNTPQAYTQLNYEDDDGEQLITGLQAGTTYHYRLVATNSSGTSIGPDETFTTLSAVPPTVETGGASQISPNSAIIAGIVDPAGEVTSYKFEIGTSTLYGTQLFGTVSGKEEVTAALAGLLPETTYHYRLLASSAAGISFGADRTFITQAVPQAIFQPSAPALLPIPVFFPERPVKSGPSPKCKRGFVKKGGKCVRKGHKKVKEHVRAPRRRK